MLKELFHISKERTRPGQERLSLQLGTHHCSYAITDEQGAELFELVYCNLPVLDENSLSAFRSAYPRTAEPFLQVNIAYDGANAVLVPSWCLAPREEKRLIEVLGGDSYGRQAIAEPLPNWQVHNLYAMPYDVQDWLNQHYPRHTFFHPASLGLKMIPLLNQGCIMIDFGTRTYSMVVSRGSNLLLVQNFEYASPADIVYQLLRVCKTFSLLQEEVSLRVTGLVEKDSALGKELHQYFLDVEYREAAWDSDDTVYPPHFFTTLNDLAQCAS